MKRCRPILVFMEPTCSSPAVQTHEDRLTRLMGVLAYAACEARLLGYLGVAYEVRSGLLRLRLDAAETPAESNSMLRPPGAIG